MNQEEIEQLSDQEIVEAYKKAASRMSFHNAAEGPSWYAEAASRAETRTKLNLLRIELEKRNVEIPNRSPEGHWLI